MRIETDQPEWMEKALVSIEELEFNGDVYTYAVLKSKLGTRNDVPENFIIYGDGVLACSDSYPKHLREFGLIHEIIEYTVDTDGEDAHDCQKAMEKELALVVRNNIGLLQYIRFRIDFFEAMILFYDCREEQEGDDLMVRKLRNTLGYLNTNLFCLRSKNTPT